MTSSSNLQGQQGEPLPKSVAGVRVSSDYMVCACVHSNVWVGLHPSICDRPYTAVNVDGQGHSSKGPVSRPSVSVLAGADHVFSVPLALSPRMQAWHLKPSRTLMCD